MIEATNANGNTAGNGINSANTSGTNTIVAKVGLGASQTWTTNGGTLAVSGAISDFNGGFGITKAGLGDLNLSGTNTFTGATTISAGILRLDSNTALSGTRGVSITNGASLFIRNSNPIFWVGQTLTLNGTGGTGSGALVTSTAGTTRWNGPVSLGSDSLVLTGGGTALKIGGTIDLSTFTLTSNAAAATTFSGTISGSGGLTKTGNSTLTLGAALNTYTGTTSLNVGTLVIASGATNGDPMLNSSAITLSQGTTLSFAAATNANQLVVGPITLSGGAGTASIKLSNNDKQRRCDRPSERRPDSGDPAGSFYYRRRPSKRQFLRQYCQRQRRHPGGVH